MDLRKTFGWLAVLAINFGLWAIFFASPLLVAKTIDYFMGWK